MTTPLLTPTTADEAAALGWTKRRLQLGLADGSVRRVLRGVYVDSAVPDTIDLRATAAALLLPARMVVVDRSASWLMGVDHWDPTDLDVPPLLDVTATSGTRTRLDGVRGGQRRLEPEDVMVLASGVPVTTPLRTAADLACQRGRLGAAAVLDQFARAYGITESDLRRLLLRLAGRRGVTQLRELASDLCPEAESPGESWVRRLVLDHRMPRPIPQFVVVLDGQTYRLDLAYPHLRIAVEYDGEDWHDSPEQRAADEVRRAALRRAGWEVIVVRKSDLSGPSLDAWVRRLRCFIQDRRRSPAPTYARGVDAGVHLRRRGGRL
ncbi:hypothetical protein [Nocardioides sp.]|uniref:endonuclease domain-containing protein n=1 Tax=Nocardioides sp. TaxID=35761 RepID=UPI0026351869|nr:hypothetical protein [Nocardioides sp.]